MNFFFNCEQNVQQRLILNFAFYASHFLKSAWNKIHPMFARDWGSKKEKIVKEII